jgi:hypothetical protein
MAVPQNLTNLLDYLAANNTELYLNNIRDLLANVSAQYKDHYLIYVLDISKGKDGKATINSNQYVFANSGDEATAFLQNKIAGLPGSQQDLFFPVVVRFLKNL